MNIILTSLLAFIATNIDDVFLLMLFFGDKRFKNTEIVIGQYIGIGTLIFISLTLSLIGFVIDPAYLGLLGFIPIYLGAKGLIQVFKKKKIDDETAPEPEHDRKNVFAVAGVTIANGGDNIGIYVPLFATLMWAEKALMIGIFFIMTAVWCSLARYLTKHPFLARVINRYGHVVTPIMLILLGMYIIDESNAISLFFL